MSDHNDIVVRFIKSLRSVIIEPDHRSMPAVMVIFESITTGVMLLLKERYDMKPEHAARMVEAALHQAIERFAAENNKETKQ